MNDIDTSTVNVPSTTTINRDSSSSYRSRQPPSLLVDQSDSPHFEHYGSPKFFSESDSSTPHSSRPSFVRLERKKNSIRISRSDMDDFDSQSADPPISPSFGFSRGDLTGDIPSSPNASRPSSVRLEKSRKLLTNSRRDLLDEVSRALNSGSQEMLPDNARRSRAVHRKLVSFFPIYIEL
jgi:hypothetical protein